MATREAPYSLRLPKVLLKCVDAPRPLPVFLEYSGDQPTHVDLREKLHVTIVEAPCFEAACLLHLQPH
jgi:hypothetical protein